METKYEIKPVEYKERNGVEELNIAQWPLAPLSWPYWGDKNKSDEERFSYDIWANYWMRNKWGERKHDIDWFIEKFMPMPTWPENWRELYDNLKNTA